MRNARKLLLDENTAEDFIGLLSPHVVASIEGLGWKGLKNGVLLDTAREEGFHALITVDKQMRYQQNVLAKGVALIVLDIHPISVPNQLACLAQLSDLIPLVEGGLVYVIEGPHPKRD